MLMGVGRVGRQLLYGIGGGGLAGPTLDLNLLAAPLDARITFTRASAGSYFDSSGTLQSAANDTPRFDYDPAALTPRGLLIEEARTNLIIQSALYTNAAWGPFGGSFTNVAGAPDGTSTAGLMTEDGTTGVHGTQQPVTISAGATVTASTFFKSSGRTKVTFGLVGAGGSATSTFDLSAGTFTAAVSSGTISSGVAAMASVGNGWYRCSMSGVTSTFTTAYGQGLGNNGSGTSYTGSGAASLYFWGAQIEVGAFPTSYIPTTAATVTRSVDQPVISPANTLPWYTAGPGGSWAAEFVYFNTPITTGRRVIGVNSAPPTPTPAFVNPAALLGQFDGVALITANAAIIGAISKVASTFVVGTGKICLNGGAVASAVLNNGYLVGVSGIFFLTSPSSVTESMTGYIRRVRYWPRVLSNAELIAATT